MKSALLRMVCLVALCVSGLIPALASAPSDEASPVERCSRFSVSGVASVLTRDPGTIHVEASVPAVDAGKRVQVLETRGAAPDHASVVTLGETNYLKCVVLRVG